MKSTASTIRKVIESDPGSRPLLRRIVTLLESSGWPEQASLKQLRALDDAANQGR
jgi:hypothetical protein